MTPTPPVRTAIWLGICAMFASLHLLAGTVDIHLQEAIGRSWPESVVQRPVTAEPGVLPPGELIVSEGDTVYATQLTEVVRHDDGSLKSAVVWFRTDLQADADRHLVLRPRTAADTPPDSGLVVDETAPGVIELRNAYAAARLPSAASTLPATIGPLLGVRLPSGAWTGASQWMPPANAPVPTRTVTVLERGPILARVQIVYTLPDRGRFTCHVTLRAGESIVRIDEWYDSAGSIAFAFGGDAAPDQVTAEANDKARARIVDLTYETEQKLMSFVGWDFYLGDRAHAIDLRYAATGDYLGLVSTDADWLPNPTDQLMSLTAHPGRHLELAGPLADGHRHWGMLVGTTAEFPKPGRDLISWWGREIVTPLEKVANWQLIWPGMLDIEFPHTFFDRADLPAIRERMQASEPVRAYMEELTDPKAWRIARSRTGGFSDEQKAAFERFADAYEQKGGIPDSVSYVAAAYLYTGKPVYLEQLADQTVAPGRSATAYLDTLIDAYRDGIGPFGLNGRLGNMHVSDAFMLRYLAWEFLLASDQLTPEQKRRVLSKIAFSVYLMHEDEWQPRIHMPDGSRPEGYPQGTANMKNCAYSCRAITGAMLANHPALPSWIDFALKEVAPHTEWTIHPSGAMLESPFYTARDTIRYVPFWTALMRAGVSPDTPSIDRANRGFSYLADMLTPPDPRMGNRRTYHAIGRSSPGVVDPTFMIGAQLTGPDDREHGERMRWAWEEQGRPSPDTMQTTGGRNIGLTLLAFMRMLEFEKPAESPLRSRRYEGFGVIMRGGVGTDYESNALFRHDPFAWDLYPPNNGAVYLYAKGVPLLPRFGGYWMTQRKQITAMSAPFGNRVLYGSGDQSGLGHTTAYALLGDVADYASGITNDKRWQRYVLYSKDLNREDGIYMLVRDEVRKQAQGAAVHWWIMTKDVQPDGVTTAGVVPINFPGGDTEWMANIGHNWARHAARTATPIEDGGKGTTMTEDNPADMPTLEEAPPPKKPKNGPPDLKGPQHHFVGQFGVDIDMFIATPTETRIVSDAAGIGPRLPYCVNSQLYEFQQLVRIEQTTETPTASFLTLLAPRLPDSPQPTYTAIADGRGVRIVTPQERVWLFLGEDAFDYAADGVTFRGQSGSCRIADTRLRMTIADGHIAADGVTLKTTGYAAILIDADRAVLWADDPDAVTITATGPHADRVKSITRIAIDSDTQK